MADETPLDRFKLALTGASRALAHEPEVEVAWSADAPTARGKHFRVPLPGRSLPADQAREARGFADSFSLKLRHHNEVMHARAMPPEPTARECFDTVERVRYEALGSEQLRRHTRQPRCRDRTAHQFRPDRARAFAPRTCRWRARSG